MLVFSMVKFEHKNNFSFQIKLSIKSKKNYIAKILERNLFIQ